MGDRLFYVIFTVLFVLIVLMTALAVAWTLIALRMAGVL